MTSQPQYSLLVLAFLLSWYITQRQLSFIEAHHAHPCDTLQGFQCQATAQGPLSATEDSSSPKVTKKVFFDIKQGSKDLGRVTIGLYGASQAILPCTATPHCQFWHVRQALQKEFSHYILDEA